MNQKPVKYGIKIWALCDSLTFYAWNLEIYIGRNRNCRPEVNQDDRVVFSLSENLNGRNVTCDNFFTSHSLATESNDDCWDDSKKSERAASGYNCNEAETTAL